MGFLFSNALMKSTPKHCHMGQSKSQPLVDCLLRYNKWASKFLIGHILRSSSSPHMPLGVARNNNRSIYQMLGSTFHLWNGIVTFVRINYYYLLKSFSESSSSSKQIPPESKYETLVCITSSWVWPKHLSNRHIYTKSRMQECLWYPVKYNDGSVCLHELKLFL